MNRILLATSIMTALCAGCSDEAPTESPGEAAARAHILAQFKGEDEKPPALDAVWTSDTMFKVAVADDGTSRDGYAEYVCGEIRAAGLTGDYGVEIVDIQSVLRGDTWREIGSARC